MFLKHDFFCSIKNINNHDKEKKIKSRRVVCLLRGDTTICNCVESQEHSCCVLVITSFCYEIVEALCAPVNNFRRLSLTDKQVSMGTALF